MAIVTQPIPALFGGVSQQSAVLRSPSQCEEAKNCSFTVADGVSKRPPLETINELITADISGVFCHWITDRNNDNYLLTINNAGDIEVHRLSDGQKLNVLNDTAQAYLVSTDAVNSLRAYTVEEKTYIVNTTTEVQAHAQVSAGTLAGTVQTLQDSLLDSAVEGSIWKVIGDETNSFDTYYTKKVSGKWVEWIKPGIQDHIDPATMPHVLDLFFDEVDPFGVRFEFLQTTWEDKLVGDEKTNKFPSFVGQEITGIFFASDRLGFLSHSSIVMSETSEHHNFFKTTVTDVLATARIDVKESSDDSTSLYWAKPLGKNIITFSANRQWALAGDPILTPQTVGMTLATKYNSSTICEPQNAGSNLYFVVPNGNSTEVREMFIQDDILTTSAAEVTSHVPSYVPKNVRLLAAQNNLDFLCMYSDETPNKLWVYQYKYSGEKKVQSAWGHWEFDPQFKVVDLHTIDNYLYVVYALTKDPDGTPSTSTYLGRINLKPRDNGIATGFSHPCNLDYLQELTGTYDGGTNTTSFTMVTPVMAPNFINNLVLVKGDGQTDKGRYFENETPFEFYRNGNDNNFYVLGDWTEGKVLAGIPYLQEYTFSTFYFKDSKGVNIDARVQVRSLDISFTDTAFFQTELVRKEGLVEEEVIPGLFHTYTARTLGDSYFTLNDPDLASGTYQFPVLSKNEDVWIKIKNPSYMPCNVQTANYKALISTRTK